MPEEHYRSAVYLPMKPIKPDTQFLKMYLPLYKTMRDFYFFLTESLINEKVKEKQLKDTLLMKPNTQQSPTSRTVLGQIF